MREWSLHRGTLLPDDGRLSRRTVLQPRHAPLRYLRVSRGRRVRGEGLLSRGGVRRRGVLQRCSMQRRSVLHRRHLRALLRDERRLHRGAVLRRLNAAVRDLCVSQRSRVRSRAVLFGVGAMRGLCDLRRRRNGHREAHVPLAG